MSKLNILERTYNTLQAANPQCPALQRPAESFTMPELFELLKEEIDALDGETHRPIISDADKRNCFEFFEAWVTSTAEYYDDDTVKRYRALCADPELQQLLNKPLRARRSRPWLDENREVFVALVMAEPIPRPQQHCVGQEV